MTIRVSNIHVHADPPPIHGNMLLHDDESMSIVPLEVVPVDEWPGFVIRQRLADTIRDDIDEYLREAERMMRTLVGLTPMAVADRDRDVTHTAQAHRLAGLEHDEAWQQLRWRYVRGDAGHIELQAAAIERADFTPPPFGPNPDGVNEDGTNWDLQ